MMKSTVDKTLAKPSPTFGSGDDLKSVPVPELEKKLESSPDEAKKEILDRIIPLLLRSSSPYLLCVAGAFLGPGLKAQEQCDFEVKVLLSAERTDADVSTLKAKQREAGKVYFFDTSSLDLLSGGVILRMRQGSDNDLTVKIRPPTSENFSDPSGGRENYKCEVDIIGGKGIESYSIKSSYSGPQLPRTGTELRSLFTDGQKDLLKQARVSIDWTLVKRLVDIQSTGWRVKANPPPKTLVLELWEWPGGRVLEASTKAKADAGPAVYKELQQLLNAKGLSLNKEQRSKTAMVLETLEHRGTK